MTTLWNEPGAVKQRLITHRPSTGGRDVVHHRNDDLRWPEFRRLDLESQSPGLEFINLAEDGAMVDDAGMEDGMAAPESGRWYWRRNPIEPNAGGASEIRRVWWEALDALSVSRRR